MTMTMMTKMMQAVSVPRDKPKHIKILLVFYTPSIRIRAYLLKKRRSENVSVVSRCSAAVVAAASAAFPFATVTCFTVFETAAAGLSHSLVFSGSFSVGSYLSVAAVVLSNALFRSTQASRMSKYCCVWNER